ncbi:OmpA family protein [Miltoncostaea oceani]|uniref:OmpA family protein n=1 Tax=Miltoncostaea oceani TaxID=2843216 RepID=UPI001C3D991C|nr:OmpA family protein [Miltoncostaea oceani]
MTVPPAGRTRIGAWPGRVDPADARADPPRPEPAAAHPLLALQRAGGNAALSRLIAGRGGVLARDPDPDAGAAPPADLVAFMGMSYVFKDVKPTTGGGLFDLAYEPTTGDMVVTVKIHFDFRDGNLLDPTWLTAVGGLPGVIAKGWTIDQFIWSDDEKAAWSASAIAQIQEVWSERFVFFSQKPGWESLPPVNVRVVVAESPKTGPGKAQWVVAVNKWPDDAGMTEAMTWSGVRGDQNTGRLHESSADAGGAGDPDSVHRTRTTGSRARYGQVDTDNPGTISFPKGGADLTPEDATRLQTFGATLGAPDIPPFPVTVTGHASAEGEEERNFTLSRRRADAVADAIVKGSPHRTPEVRAEGEAGAAPDDPAWRIVRITVGAFEATRTVVVHEFGHMLGLDDEYPTEDPAVPGGPATARPVGARPDHSALAERLIPGQQPIQAHHDESIMSNGDEVRPYHYVTFLEALGTITGTTGTWGVRPAPPKVTGPGDFPVPAPSPDGSLPA